jgi:phosphoenolpyruvate carboxykinase (ATP)
MMAYIQAKDLYVEDCFACADPNYKLNLRIITGTAWHNLFTGNMFRRCDSRDELLNHKPDFTVIHMPNFHANQEYDKTNSEVFVLVNFAKKIIICDNKTCKLICINNCYCSHINYILYSCTSL